MRSQEQAGLVLIVEDNRNISEMVGEYLESKGFEVDYASDGLDGYRLAAENNYDVVVLPDAAAAGRHRGVQAVAQRGAQVDPGIDADRARHLG